MSLQYLQNNHQKAHQQSQGDHYLFFKYVCLLIQTDGETPRKAEPCEHNQLDFLDTTIVKLRENATAKLV